MANDADWVAEVKRWYFSVRSPGPAAPAVSGADDAHDIGYEAADPHLQSRNWPDAPNSTPADLS